MSDLAPEGRGLEAADPIELEAAAAAEAGAGEPTPADEPAPYLPLRFVDVVMVLPSTHPVLVLEEVAPPHRQLRIPIGAHEGVAIAYAARQVETPRPLTHELMATILEAFSLTLDVVRISAVHGSAYEAELLCSGPIGSRTIVCRPSDAIALALRQRLPTPITAAAAVVDLAGFDPGESA